MGRGATYSLAAAATLAAALAFAPVLYLAWRALGDGGGLLDALLRLSTLEVLLRTLLLVAAVSFGSVAVGVPLAWLTTRADLPLRRVTGVLLVMPLAVPSFVMALTFIQLYGPRGLLQSAFGVERLPSVYGFAGAALLLTMLTYPFVYLAARAALARLDPELLDASKMAGRGGVRTMMGVVLPLLRPAVAVGATLSALYTLSDFGAVSLLRYNTFTAVIYQQYVSSVNLNLAAGLSLVLVVLSALIVLLYVRRSQEAGYKVSPGAARRVTAVPLGRWRWPLFALVVLFVLVAFGSHLGVLGWWLVRGASGGLDWGGTLQAMLNSAYVAVLAAVLAVALALPLALFIARRPGLYARILRFAATVGFGLPGTVLAIALVFLGINLLPLIYQTVWSLALAYVLIFLSVPLGTILASLLQINPRLEEMAASLGYSWRRRFTAVVLPLVLPGLLTGAALVFLLSVKELPATLLLSPAGFGTLAGSVWSNASEGFFARTALACCALVLAGLPLTYLLFRNSRSSG